MATLIVKLPRVTATTATTGAALVKGKHTPVDATSGAITMTLPTGAAEGVEISAEKIDTSANAVTLSGNIRGVGGSTLVLFNQYDLADLVADAAGSWWPTSRHTTRPKVQTVAYAATVTPNADTADVLNVGTLTGNITLAAPTGTPKDGQSLRMRFAQDATGSRTFTFNSAYAFGTDVTAALIPAAASSKFELLFNWHAGDSKWRAVGIIRGF